MPFNTLQAAVNRNMVERLALPAFRIGYTIETNNLDKLYKQVKANCCCIPLTALMIAELPWHHNGDVLSLTLSC